MTSLKGWLLDVYPDKGRGAVVWVISEEGERLRLTQELAITFFVGGSGHAFDKLQNFVSDTSLEVELTEQRHLFRGNIPVLAITAKNGAQQRSWFRKLHEHFPELDYFNADVALPSHYFAATQTFPLAYCTIEATNEGQIQQISTEQDRWSLKPDQPSLRTLRAEPSSSPLKALPSSIRVTTGKVTETLSTKKPFGLLRKFAELVELCDPDIIHTSYGDAWMFPYLFSIADKIGFSFNPNRDKTRKPLRVEANQFESYGRYVHRDQQTLLFGRLHIDPQNSMSFDEQGPNETFETARLSSLPIQNAARRSAGGAFVSMQVAASLEKGILIPIRKEQRERFKSANQMLAADNGGVIFKPPTGLYANVAELDFVSMYPNIMANWNISAETVGAIGRSTSFAPGIDVPIDQDETGIVAGILKPILKKRTGAKKLLEGFRLNQHDPDYLKIAYGFLKGLGWVSYGYQGFSGNRIGSIEAHEAINAISREVILQAKEVAEAHDFEVRHIYVDSLFVSIGPHGARMGRVLKRIQERTGLPIDLEGVFRWIAFLPSKQNAKVPVPNCFYGMFETGDLKLRGVMARKKDTPEYIAHVQIEAIKLLGAEPEFRKLRSHIPKLVYYFKYHYDRIRLNEVPVKAMLISQTLSRDLEDFKVATPANTAARQMERDGKAIGAGQRVKFVRVKQAPYSLSWHLIDEDEKQDLDTDWYCEQLARAADEVLTPLGVDKEALQKWLNSDGSYWLPEDYVPCTPLPWPILEEISRRQKSNRLSVRMPNFINR